MSALLNIAISLEDIHLDEKVLDDKTQSERYKRALVVVNALRGVTMLVDTTNEAPPTGIIKLIKGLQQDPVAEIRSSAIAVIKKIDRISG